MVVLLALAACGGEAEEPEPTAEPTATAGGDPLPEGTPAPEALSGLRCAQKDGKWTVSGVIANAGKEAASYQVTAYVGVRDGQPHEGRTMQLASIQPGGSIPFSLEDVTQQGDDGTCHVHVLQLAG